MAYTDCNDFPRNSFSETVCKMLQRVTDLFFPSKAKLRCTLLEADGRCLAEYLQETGQSVEQLAEEIGDSPMRLYRVLSGEETLGVTAKLAIDAVKQELPAIDADK